MSDIEPRPRAAISSIRVICAGLVFALLVARPAEPVEPARGPPAVIQGAIDSRDAAQAKAAAPPQRGPSMLLPRPSAFDGYRAWREEQSPSWRAVNDRVGEVGGWRAYLQQVQDAQSQ